MSHLDCWYSACRQSYGCPSVSSCREGTPSLMEGWQGHACNPAESPDPHTVGQRACYILWVITSEPERV